MYFFLPLLPLRGQPVVIMPTLLAPQQGMTCPCRMERCRIWTRDCRFYILVHYQWATTSPNEPPHPQLSHHIPNSATTSPPEPPHPQIEPPHHTSAKKFTFCDGDGGGAFSGIHNSKIPPLCSFFHGDFSNLFSGWLGWLPFSFLGFPFCNKKFSLQTTK